MQECLFHACNFIIDDILNNSSHCLQVTCFWPMFFQPCTNLVNCKLNGTWHKPLTNVPYKHTFWCAWPRSDARCVRWHPADVNSEVVVMLLCGEVTTSAWVDILNITRYLLRNLCGYITSHILDLRMDPVQWLLCTLTPVQYVASSWAGEVRHLSIVSIAYGVV